jgi:hypothetical protein
MAGEAAGVTPPRPAPVPATRPRGLTAFLLPLLLAAVVGLGAGLAPQTALVAVAALASALVFLPRVEWAALAVVGSAVFQGYLDAVSPWATEWLAAVLVTAWLVRRAHGPLHGHRLRVAAVCGGLLLVAVAVAFAAHPHGRPGLAVCATYAGLVVVMLVLADCLCGPLSPRRAGRLYVLSCVAASVCGIVTAVVSERHRVAGPVESADTLAFFLVAALPLVGLVRARSTQPVWWVWACFALLMVAGVGTQSRAALVGLVGMVLLAVVTGLLALRHAGALLAVVTTGVALLIAVLPLPVGQALTDPERYADANLEQQNDVRLAAAEMVRESPVVGMGPAAFSLFLQDYLDEDADVTNAGETGYSTVLEVGAELGLLGLAALYAVWLVPAIAARRRWRRDRSRLTAATLLGLDGLVAASLVGSVQYVLPLWFLAAMALAQGRRTRGRGPLFPVAGRGRTSGQVVPRS